MIRHLIFIENEERYWEDCGYQRPAGSFLCQGGKGSRYRVYFTDIFKVNWSRHLPVMYAFWENMLFYTGCYAGNPMTILKIIHQRENLIPEQFDRWVELIRSSVDNLFEGEKAELAKQRAGNIAVIMKKKSCRPVNATVLIIRPLFSLYFFHPY